MRHVLLCLALLEVPVDDSVIAPLVAKARGTNYEERIAAYDALISLGDKGKTALEPVLRDVEEKAAREYLDLIRSSQGGAFKGWLKKSIEDARKEALQIIHDTRLYPDDAHGAVGQPLVDGKIARLRELWTKPGQLFRERVPAVAEKVACIKEIDDYLVRCGRKPNRFATVEEAYAELDETLDPPSLVYSPAQWKKIEDLNDYNQTAPMSATDEERRFAKILNDYRVMLGLQPLELDDRLVSCCRKHSQEMQDMDYFAHESPVAENRSPNDRARKEGYGGGVLENCAVSSDAQDAFNGWYTSSGHHRGLIAGGVTQLGIGHSVNKDGTMGDRWTMQAGSSDSLRGKKRNENPRQILALRTAQLKPGDSETRFLLARWCMRNDLNDEGEKLLEQVVQIAPDHKGAHQLLGHVRVNGKWMSIEDKIRQDLEHASIDDAIVTLSSRLKSDEARDRLAAIRVMEKVDDKRTVPLLIGALKDGASEVRIAACDRLAVLKSTDAVGPLGALVSDPVFYVAHAAAAALHHLGDDRGIPVLFKGLRSGDLNVRIDAHRRTLDATGQDFGYSWDLPDEKRAKVVDEWEAWWKSSGSKGGAAPGSNGSAGSG